MAIIPRRTHTGSNGTPPITGGGAKIYGYGRKGNPFKNKRNFNVAVAMAKKAGRPGPTVSRPGPKGMPPIGTHRKKF